ncbi:hypothetical protein [Bacillus sp. FJAT-45037]|uniref:hypothetical protein n=1 Tax=Bacillus sp. FJAT-45037 TaxID=2011007 RepID=UPI000C23BF8A|nr:hypothetical protein [Bacillus sp. FJAT-45037]
MSIRPIEVQGSFPHSQKVGKIQEQLQQRGQVGQEIIAQQLGEEERLKRKQIQESSESEKGMFHQDEENQKDQREQSSHNKNEDDKQNNEPHPFKGKFVDYSG